ncbi:MAG: CoA pyrophosphatase [Saprospiraceae bacterium]|nr:CoA pyrophosphatase [Lewinella sp.]
MLDFINRIGEQLQHPLPGEEAQYRMATAFRYKRAPAPPTAMDAGVLALFYPKEGDWHIVLIERASRYENDQHKGQISFPGGRYEDTDSSLEFTAVRESEEEIGINRNEITVLGKLTELYIPVSNFLVHPYVAYAERRPDFQPQPSEVAAILEVPFEHFYQKKNVRKMDMTVRGDLLLREVPYFDIRGKVLWGATAMMISELLAVVTE